MGRERRENMVFIGYVLLSSLGTFASEEDLIASEDGLGAISGASWQGIGLAARRVVKSRTYALAKMQRIQRSA